MPEVKIVDLEAGHEEAYCLCLEEWSAEIREAGGHKEQWLAQAKNRGLRVKLALNENGTVGGMIQYLPIEHSPAAGNALTFILCVWVHGYPQGRGNCQRRGLGKALLAAAEDDSRRLGSGGMVAWGMILPFWMRASWFRKHGYRKIDRLGLMALLWKPFTPDAVPPRWIRPKKTPAAEAGKVVVTSLLNGWCPAMNLVHERARRVAGEWGDRVEFREIRTDDRAVFLEWGRSDALFVDDRQIRNGPPPSAEKIRRAIARRVKRL